jgi:hypothetical protein
LINARVDYFFFFRIPLRCNFAMEKGQRPMGLIQEKPAPAKPSGRYGRLALLVAGAVMFVVVALALGLGLGLGLKHHHRGTAAATSSSPTPTSSPANGTASETLQSWRRDTAEYNLDMGWDINAAPTTRVFNLTVSEIQAAPDGEPILDLATYPC